MTLYNYRHIILLTSTRLDRCMSLSLRHIAMDSGTPPSLAGSPFALLDARLPGGLALVASHVSKHEDALFFGLVCKDFYYALLASVDGDSTHERFPKSAKGVRFSTKDSGVCASVSRVEWVRGLQELPGVVAWPVAYWIDRVGMDPDRVGMPSAPREQTLVCARIAQAGQLDVLRWAREEAEPQHEWKASTCSSAAYGGHLPVLQWARECEADWRFFCGPVAN